MGIEASKGGIAARRRLVSLAAAASVVAALPAARRTARAAEPAGPVMAELSGYMAAAAGTALPEDCAEAARHHLLDTFAAMISGAELAPGQRALGFARAHGGQGPATVAASDIACQPAEAALSNGMLAHADETDDSHAPSASHPGCAVVPAALAVGETLGLDGARFLRAIALGYDVGPRVNLALGAWRFRGESHRSTHSIAGTFGAAAAAGAAAGFSAQQMRWMLDYAAQQASGIASWQRDPDHIEKAFVFGGMPARNGVTAALLVHAGATGIEDVFSGPDNFFLAHVREAQPAALVEELGRRFEVMRTNIKRWTVGSPIQAPLDALDLLRRRRSFAAAEVRSVEVRLATQQARVVDNRDMPDVCLQHMMAVMLLDGTASFAAAHDVARMRDPAVLAERRKVRLVPDAELEALLPRREAVVEVTLADGAVLRERVGAVRGTTANPMSREEVVAKCRDLIEPVLGKEKTGRLVEAVMAIESLPDIRRLRPLLQTG